VDKKAQAQADDGRVSAFGAEDLAARYKESEALQRIESVIISIDENRREIRSFTLDNGQVWQEKAPTRLRLKEGMQIYIEKGAFSAHFLGKESSNRRIKVQRIK
jgi:hypothetical protein